MNRRELLQNLSGLAVLSIVPACSIIHSQQTNALKFVSAGKISTNDDTAQGVSETYVVLGLDTDQNILWQTTLPERAHASSISPNGKLIIVTGRRPSKHAWLLDSSTGQIIQTITALPHRHFFGHTIFDSTGKHLYSTENNTHTYQGIVSKRLLDNPNQVIAEYSSYGIGCHELHILPNKNIIVVANGGIKTAENSREKLNLESMQPNLAYINLATGKLLQKIQPPHHQLSVRHIDVSESGKVAIGMQYQGDKSDNVPLLFTHELGQKHLAPVTIENDDWHIFSQYIGSVAISTDGNVCMATSPRGNCAVLIDIAQNKITERLALRDCCGVALHTQSQAHDKHYEFVISDGIGQSSFISASLRQANIVSEKTKAYQHIHFDNHMAGV